MKKIFTTLLPLILIIPIILMAIFVTNKREPTLEVGIFAGSNWNVASEDSYRNIDDAIKEFKKIHPNVNVHYYSGIRRDDYSAWLSEKALKGDLPDVFFILNEDFNKYAELGLLLNLEKLIEKDPNISKDDYFESAYTSGTYLNKQLALPYEVNPNLMAINRTLLENNNIELPSSSWSWNDFIQVCREITQDVNNDNKIDTFGVSDLNWLDVTYTNGVTLFNDIGSTSNFNDPRVIESIQFMQRINSINDNQQLTQLDFDKGKVAFMPISFAKYRTYTAYPYKINKYLDYQWDFTTMPSGPSGDNISEMQSLLMAINVNSNNKALAFDLLKAFTHNFKIQEQIYKFSQGASALKKVANSDNIAEILLENMEENDMKYNNSLLYTIMDKSISPQKFKEYNECMAIAQQEIDDVISNEMDTSIALKKLQRIIQSKLDN
ncbi:MAG: extracellular solute-binding protein [Sphaerochaetaceae bacterium]|nr:extracellular solute-binding protein [Sphaerochaetaceae bacterium]